MVEFSQREKSMVLVFVMKWLSKWHRGNFEASEILNLAEWILWRIDKERESSVKWTLEESLLKGILSLDEYVYCIIRDRKAKRLHAIADEWCGMEEYGKYFGDFA